jgi:hypothetical protein
MADITHIKDALAEFNNHYSTEYEQGKDDLLFASLQQWEDEDPSRINIVLDRTRRIINRIVNPCKMHPFGFGITAKNGEQPERIAKLNAYFDKLQSDCGAYSVYTEAFKLALQCGRSYLILGTDYAHGDGIEQRLVVNYSIDPSTTFIDTASTSIDGSDSENALDLRWIGQYQAKRLYGIEDTKNTWEIMPETYVCPEKSVPQVCYWSRSSKKTDRYFFQLENGSVVGFTIDQVKANQMPLELAIGSRKIVETIVDYEQWIGNEQVLKTKLNTKHIPVIPIYGERIYCDDRIMYKGIPFFLKGTQKLINLAGRAEAERLDLAPKSPYIAEFDQIMDGGPIQAMWDESNVKNRSALIYKRVENVMPPTRNDTNPHTSEIQATRKGLQADIDEQMGFSALDYGTASRDMSGSMASNLLEVSDIQSVGWVNNLEQSIIQAGRVMTDLSQDLNKNGVDVTYSNKQGEKVVEIVTKEELQGELNFCITTSPSGQQRKKQGSQLLATLAGQSPEFATAFADIILSNSGADIPEEAIERAKRMIPPYLKGEALHPAEQAKLDEAMQSMEAMSQTIEQYEALISQFQAKMLGDDRKSELAVLVKKLDIIGNLLLDKQKQEGKINEIEAKAVADMVTSVAPQAPDLGSVTVEYQDPMDAFTPLVQGPLVVGNELEGLPTSGS